MKHRTLIIATRKSPLALWQANAVKQALQTLMPTLAIELLGITTQGDLHLETPLFEVGGKGLFVKELELAILEKRADLAVHSMKDVPMQLPEGCDIAAILQREKPHDVFVSNAYPNLQALPLGSRIGTSSLRRQCQLLAMRPDLQIESLRGNIHTRMNKLTEQQFAAIVLAAAGLVRLGLADRITAEIPAETLLPAAGQGAIGVECRSDDAELIALLSQLNDADTQAAVQAERAFTRALNGGCKMPVAAYATIDQSQLYLRGLVGQSDGKTILRAECKGDRKAAEKLGTDLATEMIQRGALTLMDSKH